MKSQDIISVMVDMDAHPPLLGAIDVLAEIVAMVIGSLKLVTSKESVEFFWPNQVVR